MNKNLADHFPSDHLESVLSVQEIHCKDQPKKKNANINKETSQQIFRNHNVLNNSLTNCQLKVITWVS